jgi:hypothetical protein
MDSLLTTGSFRARRLACHLVRLANLVVGGPVCLGRYTPVLNLVDHLLQAIE